MSLQKAKTHLQKYGLDNRIKEFDVSSATVFEAANAIGCEEKNIVKTLSFMIGEQPILIAVAGNAKIDNHKFKTEFNTKAKMIPFEEVETQVGHAPGGVCPFGINENVIVYLDESLRQFENVYPAAGDDHSAVKLTVDELEKIAGATGWVDVCK